MRGSSETKHACANYLIFETELGLDPTPLVSRVKTLSCKAKRKICWKKRIGHSPVLQLRNAIISCLKNEDNGTRVMYGFKTHPITEGNVFTSKFII